MLLEGVGAAAAAAGGLVLRFGIQSRRTETRTVSLRDAHGGIVNVGDVGRDAIMSVGGGPAPAPRADASPPVPPSAKRGRGLIVIGSLLLIGGVLTLIIGVYRDYLAATS